MNRLPMFLLSLALSTAPLHAQDDPAGKAPPTPPETFPAACKDDEILPDSVSPDGKYGLIYPKRDLLLNVQDPKLMLIALKPFRVLTEIPRRNSLLEYGHNSYTVNWAKDSSAVVMIEGLKWGPDRVFLVPIREGQADKIIDLTAEVEKLVRPDYKKSRVEDGFIFEEEGRWEPDSKGQVVISTRCTTDPKRLERRSWTVQFQGTWDSAKSRFIRKHLTRIPPPSEKELSDQ